MSKLTEFVEKHEFTKYYGGTPLAEDRAVVGISDLESLLRGLLGEILEKREGTGMAINNDYVVVSDIRSVFSNYITLEA